MTREYRQMTRRQLLQATGLASAGLALGSIGISQAAAAQGAAATPVAGGTLNYAEAGDFQDFNPWSFAATDNSVYNQVYSRLFWKDGDGKVHADLAESWEASEDGLTFTVKLRQGAKWQDGTPVTAKDFVTMYGYLQDDALVKASAAVQKVKNLFVPITGMEAQDDLTLVMTSKEPVPYITDIIDYWFLIRIDKPENATLTNPLPIATGPFKLTEWKQNQYVRLEKNADYYNQDLPYLDEIMFARLQRAETLVPNLQSGETQGIFVGSLSDVKTLQDDDKVRVDINESAGSIFNIIVNVQKPPLDKQEVRQALAYSLDRESMTKSAFFGVSTPISTAFYSPATIAYVPDLVNFYAFDLDKSKSMLEAAGVSNLELTIVVTPAWPQMKLFSLIWQADLAKIGVKLNLKEVESAQFYDISSDGKLQGNDLEAWLNGRTTRDPAIFWNTQYNYRGGDTNRYGYVNEEMEKLVAEGAVETDPEKRKQIYQQLNKISTEACNMIAVATNPRIWAFDKNVEGVHYDLNGNVWFDKTFLNKS
ncbi:MAG TPA: ABC transporter substrate-binding protein [Thermomicrobiales bacterium]|nr:ABC transporter substrate-binding protein [Thermomicrobiales bacterium]